MSHQNIQFAKALRTNQTEAELRVWQVLRASRLAHYKFKRQVPIAGFIVDFVCFEQKLIIEIDGGHHMDSAKDVARDSKLDELGFNLLRFWNNEIFDNLEGVLMVILNQLQTATPLPSPLPQGAREL